MNEIYESLKKDGKNNVEGIIVWMKDKNILDGKEVTEDKVKKLFENKKEIDSNAFKEGLLKLAAETKISPDTFVAKHFGSGNSINDVFDNLKNSGKNTVDNVIDWMKESHLIDNKKESEEKCRKFLDSVAKDGKIELDEFKKAVHCAIDDVEIDSSGLAKTGKFAQRLLQQAPKVFKAVGEASTAIKNVFTDD